ncbi:hypothetical protein MY4824_009866 [Beauveria thailandica]
MAAPVLLGKDISVSTEWMDANLVATDPLSIFRQEPSPEVDVAWMKISDTRPIPLTREDVLALGKDPAVSVRLSPEFGLGPEMYAGRIDVLHQLHCLNALRQEAYFAHYYGEEYPAGFNTTTLRHRAHLSHCIHLLLQNILCNANTDVYTHIWTDAVEHPWPDFNIPHKCRDYRAIMEWQHSHAVDERKFVAMKRPVGQEPKRMSSLFKKITNPGQYSYLNDNPHDGANA